VVVPSTGFGLPDRRRVFYRVVGGDQIREVASLFGVPIADLCRWNALDAGASLHDGMTLQIYPAAPPRSDVLVLDEKDATVLPVGSKEFFAHFEGLRGRTRVEIAAKHGDTFRTIAGRYGLSVAQLERINGRARGTALNPGDKLVVYVANEKAAAAIAAAPKKTPAEERPVEAVTVAAPIAGGGTLDEPAGTVEGAVKPAVMMSDEAPVPKVETSPKR
jgi:membrane-bound lytic murein transglycosylase D